MSVFDLDAVLNQSSVIFCVDTNILVEFARLDAIPWHELTPNATSVRIIVPTSVAEELDAHKKMGGRLRKRGIEFSALARKIESSPHQIADLRSDGPRVTIEIGPIYRRSELDGDLYELEDGDGRIVAEFAKIAASIPGAVLLSDDVKPLRLAKQTRLLHSRPLEHWRRQEGPDERDSQIQRLQRELGPQPALFISFPGLTDGISKFAVEGSPATICPSCVDGIVAAALSVDRELAGEELIERYGLRDTGPFGISALYGAGVSPYQLDEYRADYKAFAENLLAWAQHLPDLIRSQGTMLPLTITVGNEGDRAAERIHVEAELQGAFHFVPMTHFDDLLEDALAAPDAPKPILDISTLSFRPDEFAEARRADWFYMQDEPSARGGTQVVSWRCEELRQETRHDLRVLIVAKEAGAQGALEVRVRGAFIAKPVTSLVGLYEYADPSPSRAFWDFISTRFELVPQRYRVALSAALDGMQQNCTCIASDRIAPAPRSSPDNQIV